MILMEGSWREFDEGSNLSRSFRNMWTSVLCYLNSSVNIKSHSLLTNSGNEKKAALDKGRVWCKLHWCCIHHSLLLRIYGKFWTPHFWYFYTHGGFVGTKNHSIRFPNIFLPHHKNWHKNFCSLKKSTIWRYGRQNDIKALDKAYGWNTYINLGCAKFLSF